MFIFLLKRCVCIRLDYTSFFSFEKDEHSEKLNYVHICVRTAQLFYIGKKGYSYKISALVL